MSELPELVKDLALILAVAGIVTLVFKRLSQPLVLGYIVAGFLVSPHMPYTMSVIDRADIQTWADIGVIFLLFSLGLDFSFKKILKMGAAPVIASMCIIFSMMMLGVCVGGLFHWPQMDCIFLAGMLAMSSTTIIYKAFDDLGLRQQKFTSLVMSVLILEDVLAIVMMVMLSALATGASPDGGELLGSVLRIGFFLVLWFVVGIFLIPMMLRSMRRLMSEETLLVVALGLCCVMAVISTRVGFSSAFGAFVMGSILAETVEADKIIKVVEPVKNLFGAIFFVSVGMLVEPQVLIDYALPVIAIVAAIVLGQALFGSIGYLLSGQSLKTAMKCGFSMAQIGEFAFIIASLGLSLHVISDYLYPVVVAVSVITTFLTPYMMRAATPAYTFLERHLPGGVITRLNNLQIGGTESGRADNMWKSLLSRMLTFTLIYTILSIAVVALMFTFFLPFARHFIGTEWIADALTALLTTAALAPLLRAMVMKKNHSREWKALWAENARNRLPLVFTVLVRGIIACSFIFFIIAHLFDLTEAIVAIIAIVLLVGMICSGRVKLGSIKMERVFMNNLRSRDIQAQISGKRRPLYEGRLLDRDIHTSDLDIPAGSDWAGQTLGELRLRERFGVHISSILRAGRRLNIPDGSSVIFPGDKIRAVGSDDELTALGTALRTEVAGWDYEFEKREMNLAQIVITDLCPFVGKVLGESGIRDQYNCMVVGLEEGRQSLTQPTPDYRFTTGDIIWIVGEDDDLRRIKATL